MDGGVGMACTVCTVMLVAGWILEATAAGEDRMGLGGLIVGWCCCAEVHEVDDRIRGTLEFTYGRLSWSAYWSRAAVCTVCRTRDYS